MDRDEAMRKLRDMGLQHASQDEQSELRSEQLVELSAQADAMPPGLERKQARASLLVTRQLESIGRTNRNLSSTTLALQTVVGELVERVDALERQARGDA